MRIVPGLLLLAMCLSVIDASVLVRFINTVPSRTYTPSFQDAGASYDLVKVNLQNANTQKWNQPSTLVNGGQQGGYPNRYLTEARAAAKNMDTVGLYYFPTSSSISNRNVMWTQHPSNLYSTLLVTGTATLVGGHVGTASAEASQASFNSMPPLRAYHNPKANSIETTAADRVVNQDFKESSTNAAYRPGVSDYYTPELLKADGVGLYMSFAAGTYEFQAYGVKSGNTIPSPVTFEKSAISFTFEDNKVYTIVASGSGGWSSISTASVALWSLQESTAPTTFGKAAIRFLHAISPQHNTAVDIYSGASIGSASKLHTGLAFSTSATNYFDVAPQKDAIFPIAYSTSTGVVTLAPSPSSDSTGVTFNLIAGMRATAICATTFEDRSTDVFCRMIPSRVVAYVRLVADTTGFDGLVQGKLGPQKLSETRLTLWGSYEYPHPAQTFQGNQEIMNTVSAGVPAASAGLYPVVYDVAPGTVTGYGEVHVPIFIMDFAVTTRMTPSCDDHVANKPFSNPWAPVVAGQNVDAEIVAPTLFPGYIPTRAGAMCFNRAAGSLYTTGFRAQDQSRPTNALNWHELAPIFKRVNLVLKTDGFATITNDCDDNYLLATNNAGQYSASLTDLYMEPGQYYTVYVQPQHAEACKEKTGALADGTRTSSTVNKELQTGKNFRIGLSQDISLNEITQPVKDGWAKVSFIPIGDSINWAMIPTANGAEGVVGTTQNLQQDFFGKVRFTKTSSAASTTFDIKAASFSYREAYTRQRERGEFVGAQALPLASNIALPTDPRPVHDWSGLNKNAYYANTANPAKVMCRDVACTVNTALGLYEPLAPTAFEIAAGEYTMTHTDERKANGAEPGTWACFGTMPQARYTFEAGKRYHYFVLNQFGCHRDAQGSVRSSGNVASLQGTLVEVAGFNQPDAPTQESFFSAASSVSSSLALLFAAMVAVFALVF